MKRELIAYRDPKSPVSEVFRTLRTNIQFMNTNNKLESLLIASTTPGEGKSWITANLAITFAQAGKRVILVDADMRRGRQYSIFEISPIPGLSNYLSGFNANTGKEYSDDLADYIQETEIPNLYVIPSGNIPPNPSELLISTKMVGLLDRLKELCDIVIIDGTPCELVTDSIVISRIVDSTIIVTAYKETKRDNLTKIITNIQNVGGKVSGVVLNKIPVSAKKYEQSYYYGSTSMSVKQSKKRSNQSRNNEINKRVRPSNSQSTRTSNENTVNRQRTNNDNQEIQRKIQINDSEQKITEEKTNDILKQINSYLEDEKRNLN